MKGKLSVLGLLLFFGCPNLPAQIPLGSWQTHFNYLSANHLLEINNSVFCATYNGFFRVDGQQYRVFSKSDGLNDTGISSMAYDPEGSMLLLAYRSGNMDILKVDARSEIQEIIPWPVLNETPGLPASKQISRIIFRNELAYLCTAFGIVTLDVKQREVLETYRYIGNSGAEVSVFDLAFDEDSLYAATSGGLLTCSLAAAVNKQYFANWKNTGMHVAGIAAFKNAIYTGIPGKGLFKKTDQGWQKIYSSGSSSYHFSSSQTTMTVAMENEVVTIDVQEKLTTYQDPLFSSLKDAITTDQAVWAADHKNGLLGRTGNSFGKFLPETGDTTIFPRKDSVITDLNGLSWALLPESVGGGILVRDLTQNKQRLLSTSTGSGSLPSNNINSLALDEDGNIWFASDRGIGFIDANEILTASRVDAILPVYGNRKLFSTEKCTAIVVQPGNRKWIGTRTGLYLFNADGTELIEKFTADNSPLPSDAITALEFRSTEGLLFVETPNGLVSYRSGASAAAEDLRAVTMFPNPVRPGYAGKVGFKGLVSNSTVKITELSGRLIFETRSQGGTATWDLNDYTGKRARGGIYMVFVVSGDGNEKYAGKLAVID